MIGRVVWTKAGDISNEDCGQKSKIGSCKVLMVSGESFLIVKESGASLVWIRFGFLIPMRMTTSGEGAMSLYRHGSPGNGKATASVWPRIGPRDFLPFSESPALGT